ncbi:MAG: lipid-binding SYLF domain-containing protein [Mariprofundaceae bacterium]|nr:lipid-binding SYLF domain-containing protein [Mariprofundaceae bacterium]
MKKIYSMICLMLICVLFPLQGFAGDKVKAQNKVDEARDVIVDIMSKPDEGIPPSLLRKVAAVAIFPGVVKAGFVLGGKYGRGVILKHNPKRNTWSAPAFYSIGAASIGWQIGAQSTDLILLIRSKRGLKSLMNSEFTLGADAAVAAGPVGRRAEASTDASLKAEILSYSRSRGLFAGVSLEGAKINVLESYNHAYYGKKLSPSDILLRHKALAPKSGIRLIHTLTKAAK